MPGVTKAETEDLDSEVAELRGKHESIVESVGNIRTELGGIKATQDALWTKVNAVANTMAEVLTAMKSGQGKVDLKALVAVLGLVFGCVGGWSAVYVSPIKTQLDSDWTTYKNDHESLSAALVRATDKQDGMNEDAVRTRGEMDVLAARFADLAKIVEDDHDARMKQLEYEAQQYREDGRATGAKK